MNRMQVQMMLVLLVFVAMMVRGQSTVSSVDAHSMAMKKSLIKIYESQGKAGVRNYTIEAKENITPGFIVALAETGAKEKQINWLTIAVILAEEKKDEKTLADVYYQMSEYYRLISDFSSAREYLKKANIIYSKSNDWIGQGRVILQTGVLHLVERDNLQAEVCFDKAWSIFEREGYYRGLGSICGNKGMLQYRNGDYEQAINWMEKAAIYFEKAGFISGLADLYWNMGLIYLTKANATTSILDRDRELAMYEKALPLYKKLGNERAMADVYLRMSAVYMFKKDNANATDVLNKAVPIYKKSKNFLNLGEVYYAKAAMFNMSFKFKDALPLYIKALKSYQKAENEEGQILTLNTMAELYLKLEKKEKAFECYEQIGQLQTKK